ncbi:MAG: rubrerythrin family protein [Christensenellaceae bacterium]|jgi:rubrerythrin|nr:rubrerythrin family protein [Christensenellaceae bacterium]
MTLKGTQTEKNLHEAFAGESMARNKYTYFAGKARKEGYEQIADFFLQSADNEKEHAKIWFKLLNNNEVPTTTDNLSESAKGENFEHSNMYKRFATEAKKEGFDDIAFLFEKIGEIEKHHEARYLALLENLKKNQVFARKGKQTWQCRNCGHELVGTDAPKQCPVCSHPQAYFEIKNANY